jgi:hypothetical protein
MAVERTNDAYISFKFLSPHSGCPTELTIHGRFGSPSNLGALATTSPMEIIDWNRFGDILLQADFAEDAIHVRLSEIHPDTFNQLLTLVKEGKVLAQLNSSKRHEVTLIYDNSKHLGVCWDEWRVVIEDVVASVPQLVDVDGRVVELDPIERFEFWQQRSYASGEYNVRGSLMRTNDSSHLY